MRPRAAAATWLPPARPRAMRAMLRPGAAAAAQQGSKRFVRATKWQPLPNVIVRRRMWWALVLILHVSPCALRRQMSMLVAASRRTVAPVARRSFSTGATFPPSACPRSWCLPACPVAALLPSATHDDAAGFVQSRPAGRTPVNSAAARTRYARWHARSSRTT